MSIEETVLQLEDQVSQLRIKYAETTDERLKEIIKVDAEIIKRRIRALEKGRGVK